MLRSEKSISRPPGESVISKDGSGGISRGQGSRFWLSPRYGARRQRRQGSDHDVAGECCETARTSYLQKVKAQHEQDLEDGFGGVYLPDALEQKYPNAGREWMWQYVFPSSRLSIDTRS